MLGGEPTIGGTRVPVRAVVVAFRLHEDRARVARAFPMASPAAIDEALAFYESHREEIDRLIAENEADDA
ncbi:MAG: DUF433 domain-containing protein [Chloroflexi bacterium]|nr:DUF433 domain-containing protein [Chloroflexota bacterium]